MKSSLIILLCFIVSTQCTVENWCYENVTSYFPVTKARTRVITSRRWYGGLKTKTVSYTYTELVTKNHHKRVCCEGFILNTSGQQKSCVPECPERCPEFAACVKPNVCECQMGYQKVGNQCEPKCDPSCDERAYCSTPNICVCKFGMSRNASEDSCLDEVKSESIKPTSEVTLTSFEDLFASSTTELRVTSISSLSPSTTEVASTIDEGQDWSSKEDEGYTDDDDTLVNCQRQCINGTCVASGQCQCYNSFQHKIDNLFECEEMDDEKISEKLQKENSEYLWIWAFVTVLLFATLGFFVIRRTRGRKYDVDSSEKVHVVQFENGNL